MIQRLSDIGGFEIDIDHKATITAQLEASSGKVARLDDVRGQAGE